MNKLIEPIVKSEHTPIFDIVYKRELEELEQLSNEMLDEFIEFVLEFWIHGNHKSDSEDKAVRIIEKATNKSWEEIRSLYE